MTTTTKIAGEAAMTDEQIVDLAKQVTGWTTHFAIPSEPLGHFYAGHHHQASVDNILRFARALLSSKPAEPEGWKLVPVEPTPEMTEAGKQYAECAIPANAVFCYRAMLAASPTIPAQSCGDAEQADEAVTLPIMRAAFRVVETEGDPDPDKQRFHLRFTFRSMRELDAACDEWRAFSNAARAKGSK
jgi:hypothetical protein